jgi:hypothetical protein
MRLKVRADFQCYPIWRDDDGLWLDIDPASLPISEGLAGEFDAWAAAYDATFNDEYPPESAFPDQATKDAFVATGRDLSDRLAAELGAGTQVEYVRTRLAVGGDGPPQEAARGTSG